MAFCGNVGRLVKQSLGKSNAIVGPAPTMHLFNAVRCMATKLFVGGLSFGTDDQMLREAFTSFGDVTEARVITDRDTGRSRGFGFVNFTTDESANEAMSSMDGKELHGRNIRVSVANERPSYGGGGGGGGYRGQGGYGGGGYGGSSSQDGY